MAVWVALVVGIFLGIWLMVLGMLIGQHLADLTEDASSADRPGTGSTRPVERPKP